MDYPGRVDGAKGQTEAVLLHYWMILRKRKFVVLLFTFFLMSTVLVATLLSTRYYAATAVIQISPKAPTVVEMDEVTDVVPSSSYQELQNYYATQYKIIQSRSVLEATLQSLRENNQITDFDEAPRPVDAFRKALIIEPVPQTHLVNITFEYPDPAKAVLFADSLADAYIETNHARAFRSAEEALTWLETKSRELSASAVDADQKVLDYRREHGLGGMDEQYNTTVTRLHKLQDAWSAAATERNQAASVYGELSSLLTRARTSNDWDPLTQHLSVGRPALTDLLTSRDDLTRKKEELSKRYKEGWPEMTELQGQIDSINRQVRDQVSSIVESKRAELDVSTGREQGLKSELDGVRKEVDELDQKLIDLKYLKSQASRDDTFYQSIASRRNEVALTKALQNNNIQVVDRAVASDDPVRPVLSVNLAMALIFGLFGGCAMAFAIEYLDSTVKSQEDLEAILGVPMLGVVPEIDPEDSRSLASDVERSLYVFARPRSNVAEHMRSIRTNVMFRVPQKKVRKLLITSATPREGKSFTSANLAAIIAMTGNRVLLIDADLRRPAMHKRFGLSNDIGLASVLSGDETFKSVVQHSHIPDLDIMVAGPPPPNPGELLGGSDMERIIESIEGYDFILIDSPPVTVVADPLVLSSLVDGVLVVVEANRTNRHIVTLANTKLREMKANVIGAIINKLSNRASSNGYGYGYNYYTYGYYYAESEDGSADGLPPRS